MSDDEAPARRMEIIRKGTSGGRPRRIPTASADEVRGWMLAAARAAGGKTEEPTLVIDVGEVLGITTWFIITSAGNSRLVKSIVDTVEEEVAAVEGPRPGQVEGLDSLDWVVMDYGDFVVHVFLNEMRTFYDLERLYKDMPVVDWTA